MISVMCDLETYGLAPGSIIRSLGAVSFDLDRPELGEKNINKYVRWYTNIVGQAKNRLRFLHSERHHVKPRAMGGGGEPENLVWLTYREHFLVHWLLTKFTMGPDRQKMLHALTQMTWCSKSHTRIISGWRFELVKRTRSESRKNFRYSAESRKKMSTSAKNKPPPSQETRAKLSASSTGRRLPDKAKKKLSDFRKGKKLPATTVAKMSASNKGRKPPPEQLAALHAGNRGSKRSEASRAKISAALVASHARRKAARGLCISA